MRPSEDSAAALIGSGCLNTTYSWPVATFQTRVVLSSVTVTSAPPSSEKATALISPFAPSWRRMWTTSPDVVIPDPSCPVVRCRRQFASVR